MLKLAMRYKLYVFCKSIGGISFRNLQRKMSDKESPINLDTKNYETLSLVTKYKWITSTYISLNCSDKNVLSSCLLSILQI